jgi:hypothetical protein
MSHFTVTLKISAARLEKHSSNLESAVAEMLAPYQENNMGDCPKEFLKFNDVTEEHEEKYKTDKCDRVRLPNGDVLSAYDDRFRNKDLFASERYVYPADAVRSEVPVSEVYSFEEYVTQYCGYRKDAETGRYGYWENPNRKWDWYQIGGRWSGFYPLKATAQRNLGKQSLLCRDEPPEAGHGDIVRAGDIDMDVVATKTRENAEKFFGRYEAFLASGGKADNDPWDGPRSAALSYGLLRVVQGPAEAGENEVAIPWSESNLRPDDPRRTWTDVATVVERDAFLRDYIDCFCPIITYAALDDEGWHASGKMGWFGASSDEPDDKVAFRKGFVQRFIKGATPDDTLVVVDCHI